MPSTKHRCEWAGNCRCPDKGRTEFCGFCAEHWSRLPEEKRALLLERYAPDLPEPPPVIVRQEVLPVIERVRTVYPASTWLNFLTLWCWRGGISGAVAALVVEYLRHGGGR